MVTLQIVVTEKCNLGCSYCYMNNRNTFMSREVFMEFYESLPSDEEYHIDFFGGEPLLNWDMVKFITETVSNDSRFKSFSLPSNGLLLTQDHVDFIKKYNISFSWSCDGLYEPDIEKYLEVIYLIKQLTDIVHVTVTPDTMDFVKNSLYIETQFGMRPYFKIIKENWTESDAPLFEQNYRNYIDYSIERFKTDRIINGDIIINFGVVAEGMEKGGIKPRCIDDNRKCLMPDGQIGFCGRTCSDGDFTFDFDDSLYKDCINCEINVFCQKGCWSDINNQKGLNKNLCEIYKIMVHETIRLNHELVDDIVWVNNVLRRYFNESERGS